jgi:hypothetical protein
MKRNARIAFNALTKIGAPVREAHDGHFMISGESGTDAPDGLPWADYYAEDYNEVWSEFGVNKILIEILKKHGLFAEWYNPGYLNVYDI